MKPSIVIFNTSDLPAVRQIAAGLDQPQLLLFDPTLVDRIAAERIGPLRCITWNDGPGYRERNDAAHREVHAVEAQLEAVLRAEMPEGTLQGWQHLSLYYLQMALQWFGPMFEARADAIADALAGGSCHVPVCDNAQTYYFPSFVPGLLLVQQLMRSGLPFQAYNHRNPNAPNAVVPQLTPGSLPATGDYVLAHLPTCMYDAPHFSAELQAAGKPVVRVKAKYWDVPLDSQHTIAPGAAAALEPQLTPELLARLDQATAALAPTLDAWLARWITAPAYRARQVQQIIEVYRAQLLTDQLLEQQAGAHPPSRLLLSDHDADYHGPLIAFAHRHQRPVLVLPHSKTSPDLDYRYGQATALHHPMQGEGVQDADGRRLPQFAIELPTQLHYDSRPTAALRTVGLLLNGTALSGVPVVNYRDYGDGIRRIVAWCQAQGLVLKIRSRPGQTLVRTLVEDAGLAAGPLLEGLQGSMVEFAQACDLCLMYDAPTSGALELLTRAIPILNPVVTAMTQRETATVDPQLVPRADVDEILRLTARLVGDPVEYQRFRRWQFAAFAERLGTAQSLRSFV